MRGTKGGVACKYVLPWIPVRAIVTTASRDDSKEAYVRVDRLYAKYLLADLGDNSNQIVKFAMNLGIFFDFAEKNHKTQRSYDKNLYKIKQLIEISFPDLKRSRGIATCYIKCMS